MLTHDLEAVTITNIDIEAMTAVIEETGQTVDIIAIEDDDGNLVSWAQATRIVLATGPTPDDYTIVVPINMQFPTVH